MSNEHERKLQEREKLRNIIAQWNANRLDIFAISDPTENLEFHGVMRFYSLDAGQKVATKCIRVASTATTQDVIETLIEKFRPDIRMLSFPEYALYEVHENGEERKLSPEERPLLVQLNWHKDDREGRFLLRRLDEKFELPRIDPSFRRKLSKREKKEKKKREKKEKLKGHAAEGDEENRKDGIAEQLYNEMPETSFTRSISNPEAVMRRRRQQKLEKKLQQFRQEGGSDAGGTLRIFGEAINRDVPYKTLLLSTKDTAAFVVREMLDKYGIGGTDPSQYCLVQVIADSPYNNNPANAREYILDDDDCPLAIERQFNRTKGMLTFHLRRRPADYQARKRKKKLKQPSNKGDLSDPYGSNRHEDYNEKLPFLLELLPDGSDVPGGGAKKHILYLNVTEVGSDRPTSTAAGQYLQLVGGHVHPRHCVIAHTEGIVTVTPSSREAETFVNGTRIMETTILQHGAIVQFGPTHHTYRFMVPQSLLPPTSDYPERKEDQISCVSPNHRGSTYETTFDADGNIETVSTHSRDDRMSRHSDSLSYEAKRGTEPILPAVLEFPDKGEEMFLNSIITYADPSKIQFKLAPTYALYLAARYRASTHYLPDVTPTERAHRLTGLMNRVAGTIHQTVQDRCNQSGPDGNHLAFWLANASELLHFLKQDRHLSAYTLDAQDLLAECVQLAFRGLVTCQQAALTAALPAFLTEADDDDVATGEVLLVLSGAMSLLRRFRVNAALTIQLFSQLFHHINMWLFNRLVDGNEDEENLCTRAWGARLTRRLSRIQAWAEKQGLELAADCHLSRIVQAAHLLQSPKGSPDDIAAISAACFKLNSVQLRTLLEKFVASEPDESVAAGLAERVARVAQSTADELARADGRPVRLREDPDLQLPFLLPEDGYSCDVQRGLPTGFHDFLQPLIHAGACNLTVQHSSSGFWTIYMADQDIMKLSSSGPRTRSPSLQSSSAGGPAGTESPTVADIQEIRLNKSNNGIGLSIVACGIHGQSHDSDKLGIYVKSVVKGGAADQDGRLEPGDQLLKVDGHSLIGITQEKAAELMTRTGPVVTLEVYKHGAVHHGIAHIINKPSPVMHRGPGYHPGPRRMSERDLPTRVTTDLPHDPKAPPGSRIQSSKSVPSLNNVQDRPPLPVASRYEQPPLYNHLAASTTSLPKASMEYDAGRTKNSDHQVQMPPKYQDHPPPKYQHHHPSQSEQHQPRYQQPSSDQVPKYHPDMPHHPRYQYQQEMSSKYHQEELRRSPQPPGEEHHYQNISFYNNIGNNARPSQQQPPQPRSHHHNSYSTGLNRPPQAGPASSQGNFERARPISTLVSSREHEQYANTVYDHRSHEGHLTRDYPGSMDQLASSSPIRSNDPTRQPQFGPPPSHLYPPSIARQPLPSQHDGGGVVPNSHWNSPQMSQRTPAMPQYRSQPSSVPHQPYSPAGNMAAAPVPLASKPRPQPQAHQNLGRPQYPPTSMAMHPPSNHQMTRPSYGPPYYNNGMGSAGMGGERRMPSHPNTVHQLPPPAVSYRYGPSGYPPAAPASSAQDITPNNSAQLSSSTLPPSKLSTEDHRIKLSHSNLRNQHSDENKNIASILASPSPWAREEREKVQRQRLEEARRARDAEVRELESLSHRTPRQEERLRTLRLEQEFQRRAEELHGKDGDDDEEEEEDEDLLERAENRERMLRVKEDIQRVRQRHLEWSSGDSNKLPQQETSSAPVTASSIEEREQKLRELHIKENNRLRELEAAKELEEKLIREAQRRQDEATLGRHNIRNNYQHSLSMGSSSKDEIPPPLPTSPPPSNISIEEGPPTGTQRLDNLLLNTSTPPQPPERKSSYEVTGGALRNGDHHSQVTPHQPKKVSFQDPVSFDNNGNDQSSSYTLQDIDEVLATPQSNNSSIYTATGTTPGVIGAQEVYRDPRQRIEAERYSQPPSASNNNRITPEKLTFKEKMKMFAKETGEPETPRDKVKISRAQRDIETILTNGNT